MTRDEIVKTLKESVCKVKFTKKDGTERLLTGTLRPDLLPEADLKETRQKTFNVDVVPVWDLDKHGWRSFRVDSLIGDLEVINVYTG